MSLSFTVTSSLFRSSAKASFCLLFAALGGLVSATHAYASEVPTASDSSAAMEAPSETCYLSSIVHCSDFSDDLLGELTESGDAIAPIEESTLASELSDESTLEAESATPSVLETDSPTEFSGDSGVAASSEITTSEITVEASSSLTLDETLSLEEYESQLGTLQGAEAIADLQSIGIGPDSMAQVTSVTQLSDVRPTDWAYQALSGLIERYGCIAGYPDGTFRGNQSLSRYEFAAGLNACLEGFAATLPGEDLGTIQQLQQEFADELANLRGRVDSLEARITQLEANQFSTTSKLFGQVVVGIQGRSDYEFESFRNTGPNALRNDTEINLVTNAQLSLFTQFDSRSILLTGLQMGEGNTSNTPGLSDFTRLGYEGDTGNQVELSDLTFRHLIGRNLAIIVGPEGLNAVNTFRGINRVEGAGFGPLSRFAQRNPVIGMGAGSGGVGFDWQIANWASLQGVYSASTPANVDDGGIFGGDNGVTTFGAQLVLSPSTDFDISLQYLNSYSPFGRLFMGVGDDQVAVVNGFTGRAPIQTDAFGAGLEWRISSGLTAGGWFGYTNSELLGESGSVETINWMAFLNFPDLFGDGNLAGIYVGQPPKITNSDLPLNRNIPSLISEGQFPSGPGGQPATTTHVEAFYRWRVTDNIAITPGFILLFNPGHNADNDTVFIGALRTTFTF